MKKVYENKEEGVQVLQDSINGRFYPRHRIKMIGFLSYWATTCMGQFNDTAVSMSTKEQAIALGQFFQNDPEAQKLGMNLKQNTLERIAQMRMDGLKVEIDETTKDIKKLV